MFLGYGVKCTSSALKMFQDICLEILGHTCDHFSLVSLGGLTIECFGAAVAVKLGGFHKYMEM